MMESYFVKVIEDKIKEHLSKMTIEEKVWQMGMIKSDSFKDESGNFSREKADKIFKGHSIGGFQDPRLEPERSVEFIKQAQDYLKFNTKPGIPAIVVGETLHGYLGPKATIFPQVIGMASTWNTELVEAAAEAASKEARAVGTNLANVPDLDLAREPRWGRVEETFGEDPYLVSKMGLSTIKGMQGAGDRPLQETVISSIKQNETADAVAKEQSQKMRTGLTVGFIFLSPYFTIIEQHIR